MMAYRFSKSKKPEQKAVREWDEDERGEQWFGDVMIPLNESGDQRSTKKENIKSETGGVKRPIACLTACCLCSQKGYEV